MLGLELDSSTNQHPLDMVLLFVIGETQGLKQNSDFSLLAHLANALPRRMNGGVRAPCVEFFPDFFLSLFAEILEFADQ